MRRATFELGLSLFLMFNKIIAFNLTKILLIIVVHQRELIQDKKTGILQFLKASAPKLKPSTAHAP